MKYKIGDRVKYDDGEWMLYGTVSAVYEQTICPFYRVNIERKEKKNGKYSIVQFEFELETDREVVESEKEKRNWNDTEIEYLKTYYGAHNIEDMAKVLKRTTAEIEDEWKLVNSEPEPKPKQELKGKQSRKRKLKPEPESESEEEITQKSEKETLKRKRGKRGEAWSRNFEQYRKGEKSNVISTWMAQNRREYKSGKLSEAKFEKLVGINFPFDVVRKKKTIIGTTD
jgi:hypothetical protein